MKTLIKPPKRSAKSVFAYEDELGWDQIFAVMSLAGLIPTVPTRAIGVVGTLGGTAMAFEEEIGTSLEATGQAQIQTAESYVANVETINQGISGAIDAIGDAWGSGSSGPSEEPYDYSYDPNKDVHN